MQRLDAQRDAVTAEGEQVDTEAAVLEELAALRALVVDEARDGGRHSIDAFRAALRRLFAGFELLGGPRPYGSGGVRDKGAMGIPHKDLVVETGEGSGTLALFPHVRKDAIESWGAEDFPALRRAALSLRGTDANSLTT